MTVVIIGDDAQVVTSYTSAPSPTISSSTVSQIINSYDPVLSPTAIVKKWIEENKQFVVHFISVLSDGSTTMATHYHNARDINLFYEDGDLGITPLTSDPSFNFEASEGSPSAFEDTCHYSLRLTEDGFSILYYPIWEDVPNGNKNYFYIVLPEKVFGDVFVLMETATASSYCYAHVSTDTLSFPPPNFDDPSTLLDYVTSHGVHKIAMSRGPSTGEQLVSAAWRGKFKAIMFFSIRHVEAHVFVRPLMIL